eukprot:5923806-Prymnesium_polylepis.1
MAAQVQLALTLGPVVTSFLQHSGVHDRPSPVELWASGVHAPSAFILVYYLKRPVDFGSRFRTNESESESVRHTT